MTHQCIEPRPERELELALFAGGDLAAEEEAAVESHLAACPACRDMVRELRESHAGFATLADEPIDPGALARIRHAVRRRIEEEAVSAGREERRPAWLLPLAAGLVLALLAAAVWLRSSERENGTNPSPGPPQVAEVPPAPVEIPETAPAPPPDLPAANPPEEAEPATRPAPEPVRQARAERPAPVEATDRPPTESMVIQVVSEDPDIVFYWLVEPEETEDETVSS